MLTGEVALEGALPCKPRALAVRFAAVLVTAGGDGVASADGAGAERVVAAIAVDVKSAHGAGDTFIGPLAAELARGSAMPASIDAANRAAAKLVATPEADR